MVPPDCCRDDRTDGAGIPRPHARVVACERGGVHGHEGDCCLTGFSPRKKDLTLYLAPGIDRYAPLLAKLGKHRAGKGCLYVKRLADVDLGVLRDLLRASVADLEKLYPS